MDLQEIAALRNAASSGNVFWNDGTSFYRVKSVPVAPVDHAKNGMPEFIAYINQPRNPGACVALENVEISEFVSMSPIATVDYKSTKELIDMLPELPQRQDSTNEQLKDLYAVATRLGLYDAGDAVRRLAGF